MRGRAIPMSRHSPSEATPATVAMPAGVSLRMASRSARWFDARATRSRRPASIITDREPPPRASSHSVWPTKPGSASATWALDSGAVQSAPAWPPASAPKAASR